MFLDHINALDADTIVYRELFVELFDIENEIDRTEILNELLDLAKEFKVKDKFNAMYSAFLKEEKKKIKEEPKKQLVTTNNNRLTEFVGSYDELNTGAWIATENGIYTQTVFGDKIACPHPIMPIQILTNAETGFCKIKLAYKIRGRWNEKTVDKETISTSGKITELSKYGIMVTSENARALVQYLSDVESLNEYTILERVSTSKLGWINKEFMPYGENIEFDNEQNLKSVFDSIKSIGSRDIWYALARSIRKLDKFETKIYIAAALASILIEPLNALPFVVNLWGDTGKGKTVALMLATSVWANPSEGAYMTDAKATPTALEMRLDFLNSLPLLLDDMAQIKTQYDGDFSQLIYLWCAGKGKDRSNKNLGLNKPTSWRNVIITNAEHSLITETMQGGAVNRIIDVEMSEGYIFDNGNDVVEILKDNYGFCGRDFVEVVKEVGIDDIKTMQKEFYNQIIEIAKSRGVEKEEKQMLPMSILLTADKLSNEYLFKDNCILDISICVDLLKNRNEVSENERAYQFILSEVQMNYNRFIEKDEDIAMGEYWGMMDKERNQVIISSNAFARILNNGGFSERTFLSWAAKHKIIEVDSEGKFKKKKRIKGMSIRCVFMKTDYVAKKLDDGFEESDEPLPFN